MPGSVPGIHVLKPIGKKGVDGRDKPGHDGAVSSVSTTKIAIPVGDPAGIGPEIALKAALDPAVRAACDPVIVCDPDLLKRHAQACGLDASKVNVIACPQSETASLGFGVTSPIAGRASIAFCAAAVKAAMAGTVDAVVAAPQNETSIAQAGIPFDGHPSFVARQTGTDESGGQLVGNDILGAHGHSFSALWPEVKGDDVKSLSDVLTRSLLRNPNSAT